LLNNAPHRDIAAILILCAIGLILCPTAKRSRRKITTASCHRRVNWRDGPRHCLCRDGPARVLAISRQCFAEMRPLPGCRAPLYVVNEAQAPIMRISGAPRVRCLVNGLLVVADAANEIAHPGDEAHLREYGRGRARLWSHVADLGDLTFRLLSGSVKLLAHRCASLASPTSFGNFRMPTRSPKLALLS